MYQPPCGLIDGRKHMSESCYQSEQNSWLSIVSIPYYFYICMLFPINTEYLCENERQYIANSEHSLCAARIIIPRVKLQDLTCTVVEVCHFTCRNEGQCQQGVPCQRLELKRMYSKAQSNGLSCRRYACTDQASVAQGIIKHLW